MSARQNTKRSSHSAKGTAGHASSLLSRQFSELDDHVRASPRLVLASLDQDPLAAAGAAQAEACQSTDPADPGSGQTSLRIIPNQGALGATGARRTFLREHAY